MCIHSSSSCPSSGLRPLALPFSCLLVLHQFGFLFLFSPVLFLCLPFLNPLAFLRLPCSFLILRPLSFGLLPCLVASCLFPVPFCSCLFSSQAFRSSGKYHASKVALVILFRPQNCWKTQASRLAAFLFYQAVSVLLSPTEPQ